MIRLLKASLFSLLAGLLLAGPGLADPTPNIYCWNLDTPGDVNVPGNWVDWNGDVSTVVPGTGNIAVFKKPGLATISSTSMFSGVLNDIWVGDGSTTTQWPEGPLDPGPGNVVQTSGTVQYANWLVIGRAGQTGVYDLQGGSIQQGAGGGQVRIGEGGTGDGTLKMTNDSSVTVNDITYIGISGTGKVTMANTSSFNVADLVRFGYYTGASGTLEMSGDAKASFEQMEVGFEGSHGDIKLSGNSELTVPAWNCFGQATGTATLTMSGNSKYYGGYGRLGEAGGNGTVTVTMDDNARIQWTGWFAPGAETSTCNMTLNTNASIHADGATDFSWGQAGVANVTVNGTSSITTGTFSMATHAVAGNPSLGTLTLNDSASVAAGWIYLGHIYGEATVYMNDSSSMSSTGAIALADYMGGKCTVNMTGDSTMSAGSWLAIGNAYAVGDASGYAEVFMSGNSQLNAGDHLEVAYSGTGILHIGGDPADNAVVRSQAGPLYLGYGTETADTNATINLNRGGTLETHGIITGKGAEVAGPLSSVLNINGGTLRALADNPDFMTNAGQAAVFQANVLEHGAVIDTNGFNITLNVPLTEDAGSPGGGVTKVGDGVLILGGASTYTGATVVEEGGLAVDGSIASDVTVDAGASLLGNGTITGAVTVAGVVAPGASIGTLTVDGDLALGGTLDVEYDSDTGDCDKLAVSGELDLTGATLSFTDLGSTGHWGPYVIATYGTLVGDPATELGLTGDQKVVYDFNGNSIALVPEPGMFVLLAGLAAVLLAIRIRR